MIFTVFMHLVHPHRANWTSCIGSLSALDADTLDTLLRMDDGSFYGTRRIAGLWECGGVCACVGVLESCVSGAQSMAYANFFPTTCRSGAQSKANAFSGPNICALLWPYYNLCWGGSSADCR